MPTTHLTTVIAILFGLWLFCAFILGVFVGRFIKVGRTAPVRQPVEFERRRQELRAGLGRAVRS